MLVAKNNDSDNDGKNYQKFWENFNDKQVSRFASVDFNQWLLVKSRSLMQTRKISIFDS